MAQCIRRLILAAILAVVVMLFSAATLSASAALTATQTSNTLAFLQDFPGALTYLKTRWTGTDYCSWEGITCDGNGYVQINLSGKGLVGYMPSMEEHIDGTQVMVTSIDLSNNVKITGNFKSDWAAVKNLQSLDLSTTGLYGNLPDAWNGMAAIETIRVRKTLACRNLPNWNMTTLRTVDLSSNNLGGNLASSWSGMTNLNSVDITGNSFCGCVPSSWQSSTVLTNAAAAIGGNLVASDCNNSNRCGDNSYRCPSAASAPLQLTVALLAVIVAIAAVMGF